MITVSPMATKLHAKHIVAGFLYANAKEPNKLKMVTEVMLNNLYCKIYLVDEMKYQDNIPRQAIVNGVRSGTLISFMDKRYR